MIHLPEIWNILIMRMPSGWIPLQEIYAIIKKHHALDDEDYYPESPNSDGPKWKRNVRNVLQYRRKTGEIEWDNFNNKYRLTPMPR
jgi:hypothetical protein